MDSLEMGRIKRELDGKINTIEDIDTIIQYLVNIKQNMIDKGIKCHHCQLFVAHDQVWIAPYKSKRHARDIFCFTCIEKSKRGFARKCNGYNCNNTVFTHSLNKDVRCEECDTKNHGQICIYCQQKKAYYHFYGPHSSHENDETTICNSCFIQREFTDDLILKERGKVRTHNNRAKTLSLPANLTLSDWLLTLDDFGWKCAYCERDYQVLEHFIPLNKNSKGGTTKSNCVPSCSRCNNTKYSTSPKDITFIPQVTILNIENYLKQFS